MPELPEVETTRRGIEPLVAGRVIVDLVVREPRLRWPVSPDLPDMIRGQRIEAVQRRGKYLLLPIQQGALILHLGMSGSLRMVAPTEVPARSDHIDLVFDGPLCLRLRDPRRFGCLLWSGEPHSHPLLRQLGPEPLEGTGQGQHLYRASRGRRRPIRDFLLDGRIIAGIGNIYANEALFRAGIDPRRAAGRISADRYERLAVALRETLTEALAAGGTTLRDFSGGDGRPGYFQQSLQVYGRRDGHCLRCNAAVKSLRLGTRSVFFCPKCQS